MLFLVAAGLGVAFHSYSVSAGAMAPTLVKGDYLIVSNVAYVFGHSPDRGDIVALRRPRLNRSVYIKRIVGIPGDRIQLKNGVVYLNGAPLQRVALGRGTEMGPFGLTRPVERFRETLPSGRFYTTFSYGAGSELENTGTYLVPSGQYFVLGDNRDNAVDSRLPEALGGGYVPAADITGRAEVVISWSGRTDDGRSGPSFRVLK